MSAAHFGDTYTTQDFEGIDLPDEVYVGIYICAHNNTQLEKGVFRNVRLVRPARPGLHALPGLHRQRHRAARRETRASAGRSTARTTRSRPRTGLPMAGAWSITTTAGCSASTWPPSSRRQSTPAPRSTATTTTRSRLTAGCSASAADRPRSCTRCPSAGAFPRQITPTGPSYFHGWSPDGKYLVFTGASETTSLTSTSVPSAGGPEERLTTAKGLDDGSEYTPDGKTIFFNSERTGKMQVWKMNADGSGQTQMTSDEYNNWFPHVSPDGKTVLFISFPPEIPSGDHPFLQARLSAQDADRGRKADGRRLRLWRAGLDQREFVVAGQPDGGLREQLGSVLTAPAQWNEFAARRDPGGE